GRNDHQVKIRGHRIELGEIENALMKNAAVKNAAVIVKNKDKTPFLVAVCSSDEQIESAVLTSFLSKHLPAYMIPTIFSWCKEIPLTKNGKIDRNQLSSADYQNIISHKKAENQTQLTLLEIWADILKLEPSKISINQDFFELGGSSIIAFHVISGIKSQFSKTLPIKDIFEYNTIEHLAARIDSLDETGEATIEKVSEQEHYITSAAQERMFYNYLINKDSLTYNISGGIAIEGAVSIEKLKTALHTLLDRHEGLRTSFVHNENGLFQKIHKEVNMNFEIISSDQISFKEAFHRFIRPHDLEEQNSLIRFALYRQDDHRNLLFVDVHHIICDGFSIQIILNDFKQILQNNALEELPINYADYANWQRNENNQLRTQEAYWTKQLTGELPSLELSYAQHTETIDISEASVVSFKTTNDNYKKIKNLVRDNETSEFMFFLSVYYLLLHKITGKHDLIIGTDVLGRTHSQLKNVIGTFVNILPLRISINEEQTYGDFLKSVKSIVLGAFENQDFQFDDMVKMKADKLNAKVTPIAEVHFAFNEYNQDEDGFIISDLKFSPLPLERDLTTQYEFKLEASDTGNAYLLDFIYSVQLYEHESINLFGEYYAAIVEQILSKQEIQLQYIGLNTQVPSLG
ncbi:condensation domain-containing protein, partial [Ascidiimonas sp. W6]|uniref:condensation domain-containing protein n=1 Tax=Ascidiimonas meishanensis TaxID=3128903 RepID=UPI0030EC0169